MTTSEPPRRLGRILVNHLGFLCDGDKRAVVTGARGGEVFEVQNMALNKPAAMGSREDFQAVLTGHLAAERQA